MTKEAKKKTNRKNEARGKILSVERTKKTGRGKLLTKEGKTEKNMNGTRKRRGRMNVFLAFL